MKPSKLTIVVLGLVFGPGCASDSVPSAWVDLSEDGAKSDNDDDDADEDEGAPADDDDVVDSAPSGMDSDDPSDSASPTITITAGDESSSGDSGEPNSPYSGGWDIGSCQDMITAGEGIAPDVVAIDQFGEEVRLYDFCHKAVIVHAATFT